MSQRALTQPRTKNYFPLLPFVAASVKLFILLASYLTGVIFNKSMRYVPYPHELGLQEPERGLYGLGLTLSAMITFCVLTLRYVVVNNIYPRKYRALNIISLFVGVTMLIGQIVMAIYPNNGSLKIVNFIGLCVYHVSLAFYMVTQAYLSQNLRSVHSRCIIVVRIVCSLLALSGPILYTLTKLFIPSDNKQVDNIPAASEWFMHLLSIVFIYSFCADFNKVKIRSYFYETHGNQGNKSTRKSSYVDYLRSHVRAKRRTPEQTDFKYHVTVSTNF